MKKVAIAMREVLWEKRLRSNVSTLEDIRMDAFNDLNSMKEDFQMLETMLNSVQENYQALLQQNTRLKAMLLNSVDDCYCWQGNRCDRCIKIIQLLAEYD